MSDLVGWAVFGAAVAAIWARDAVAVATGQVPTSSSALEALQPDFRARAVAFMADAASAGTPLRVDETYRSYLRQEALRKVYLGPDGIAGTADDGPRAAMPGKSRHEIGRAFDVWPIGVSYSDPHAADRLDALSEIAAKHGLKNLGSIGDHDHWEDAA